MLVTLETEITSNLAVIAEQAGLEYVQDSEPGISRKKFGKKFRYYKPNGQPVTDEAELERIRKLGIPPAHTNVWICPRSNGHIQATGRDAKGRKQYRYHARWREVRDETKYQRVLAFGAALPKIRQQVEADLKLAGLPRRKVLAAVVRLLETTLIRVGNEEYARKNRSFGLTTMRDRHVKIEGWSVRFQFKGKSGKKHSISVRDRRLANIVQRCRDIPGQELFQYLDAAGQRQNISSADINAYLREITGEEFSAKDFRTWAGTLLAALTLQEMGVCDQTAQAKKNLVKTIKQVAAKLGNTPAICRKCYIHPIVLQAYLDGVVVEALQEHFKSPALADGYMEPAEIAVLHFLETKLHEVSTKTAETASEK